MFEHMKNYQELLRRCAGWLRPGGQLFVHIFTHRDVPYHFEVRAFVEGVGIVSLLVCIVGWLALCGLRPRSRPAC